MNAGGFRNYSNRLPPGWQGSAPVLRCGSATEDGEDRLTEGGLHPHRLRRGSSEGPKSGWSFVREDIGGELLMLRDCPDFQWGKAEEASEFREVLGMATSGGCALIGLKTVPGGLPRAPLAGSLCPGLTSGCAFGARNGSVSKRGSMGKTRWIIAPGRRGQVMADCRDDRRAPNPEVKLARIREMRESWWSFISEVVGGELVMALNCPELREGGDSRGGGVKAAPVHRDRSPRPGGLHGGLEHDEHPWELSRRVNEADRGGWKGRECRSRGAVSFCMTLVMNG